MRWTAAAMGLVLLVAAGCGGDDGISSGGPSTVGSTLSIATAATAEAQTTSTAPLVTTVAPSTTGATTTTAPTTTAEPDLGTRATPVPAGTGHPIDPDWTLTVLSFELPDMSGFLADPAPAGQVWARVRLQVTYDGSGSASPYQGAHAFEFSGPSNKLTGSSFVSSKCCDDDYPDSEDLLSNSDQLLAGGSVEGWSYHLLPEGDAAAPVGVTNGLYGFGDDILNWALPPPGANPAPTTMPSSRIPPGVIEDGVHVGLIVQSNASTIWFDRVDLNADGTYENDNPMLRALPYSAPATDGGVPIPDLSTYTGTLFVVTVSDQRVSAVAVFSF